MTHLQKQPLTQLLPHTAVPRQLTTLISLKPRKSASAELIGPLAGFIPKLKPEPETLPELPTRRTYSVKRANGYISRIGGHSLTDGKAITIELPFGTPRTVNAVTLKLLLGGSPSETLLKKTGGNIWAVCDDSTQIDLKNRRVQFRLGQIAVYS